MASSWLQNSHGLNRGTSTVLPRQALGSLGMPWQALASLGVPDKGFVGNA